MLPETLLTAPPSGANRHDKRSGEEGCHLLQGLLHAHPQEVQGRGRGGVHQDHVQGNSQTAWFNIQNLTVSEHLGHCPVSIIS